MPKTFLPLVSYLVKSITTRYTEDFYADFYGQMAFTQLADTGKIGDVAGAIAEQKKIDAILSDEFKPELKLAISCGQSAKAFGALFFGPDGLNTLANQCENIEALKVVIQDKKQRLIRIDIGGHHSYVIEQIDSDTLQGNVYQSNIAVFGHEKEHGCTVEDFLQSHKNPVNLVDYLEMVKSVCDPTLKWEQRYELYKNLYVTKGFLERQDPSEAKIKKSFEAEYKKKLDGSGPVKISWREIDKTSAQLAYNNCGLILSYRSELLKGLEELGAY
jgi:hypothetical protein